MPTVDTTVDTTAEMYTVKVYKLTNTVDDCFYVGSTKQRLSQRLHQHKKHCRQGRTARVYEHMRDVGIDTYQITLVETKQVVDFEAQRQFERAVCDRLKNELGVDICLNMNRAHITADECKKQQKQHYERNKELILQQQKQHYERNKERILRRQKQYDERNKERTRARRQAIKANKTHYCAVCDKAFACPSKLTRHESTRAHQRKLALSTSPPPQDA